MTLKNKFVFTFLLLMLLVDRVCTLVNFGFVFTDIDQVVMWEGAIDYSSGIFHEPFFYGQNYNFMLESFLAVPLLWFNVPVYMAVPIVTNLLAIFPFVILSIFFIKRKSYLFAYLTLIFPVLLPLEFNFLTSMPRGFIQANLFIPLLYFSFFNPERGRSITLFFIGSSLCFFLNPSSVLIIFPIGIYLLTYHYNKPSFYLKSLIVVPFVIAYGIALHYYDIHPEKLILHIEGIDIEIKTFIEMITRSSLFEYLFPFVSSWGVVYPLAIVLLLVWTGVKRTKKEFLFTLAGFVVLMVSLSVPKVLFGEVSSGVFYSASRLFLGLPILFILMSYMAFKKVDQLPLVKISSFKISLLVVVVGLSSFVLKNKNMTPEAEIIADNSSFPVEKISDLIPRIQYIDSIAKKHKAEALITNSIMGWEFAFEGFSYNTVYQILHKKQSSMISLLNVNDRRTWLYDEAEDCKNILIYMGMIDEDLLASFETEKLGNGFILIKNNSLPLSDLFGKLNLSYGLEVN